MKIAMIGQKGIPTISGGVEKHVEELAVRLVKQDRDIIVYTRPWYTPKHQTQYRGVRLVSLPSLYTKHFDAISHTLLAIIHAAYKEKVDIFHIHAVGPSLLSWLPRLLRPSAKVVVTFHCIDRQHQKWGRFARVMLWGGEWAAMTFAHAVITVSKTLQDYAYEVYHRTTHYIPNGIAQTQVRPASVITSTFGLTADSYILMVTRLVPHKGIHYLIEAYQQLQTDKKLVIVGGESFTDKYVQRVQALAANQPNIIFTGTQTGQMLAELFSNAYIFVLPSESEGLPIVLLEAASFGRPLLVSDIPANVEVVQTHGVTFANGNVTDLAKKLQQLLDDPTKAKQLGKQVRQHVLKQYHWDDSTAATTELYQTVRSAQPRIQPALVKSLPS